MKANAVTMEIMNEVATYMNDEIREDIHLEKSPCTNEEFLIAYCNADPDFEKWCLNDIFGIEL